MTEKIHRFHTLPDPAKLAKTPVWVQDLVHRLIQERDAAERAADEARLSTEPEDSDTVIERLEQGTIGLGNGTSITFKAGDNRVETFNVRLEKGTLIVMGGSSIGMRPSASNLVMIDILD